VKKSIFSAFAHSINQTLLNRTAVLTDNLYGVKLDKADKSLSYGEPPSSIDCLIVGKEHYSEDSRSYPIQSSKEMKKIMALEAQASEELMLYIIGPYVDGMRTVVTWKVQRRVVEQYEIKPWFIVPESALLVDTTQAQLLIAHRANRTFWFTHRQGQFVSAEKKGLIANEMMFLTSAGLNVDIEPVTLDESAYLDRLMGAIAPRLLSDFGGFKTSLRQLKTIDWASHIKYSGAVVVLLLSGYFGITSLYLSLRLQGAEQAAIEYRDKTREIFTLNAQQKESTEKSVQLTGVVDLVNSPSVFWRVVGPLAEEGVIVKQLRMIPDGTFSVSFEAKRATDVLARFSRDKAILDPKFRGQTIKVKDKERFTIAFKINKEA